MKAMNVNQICQFLKDNFKPTDTLIFDYLSKDDIADYIDHLNDHEIPMSYEIPKDKLNSIFCMIDENYDFELGIDDVVQDSLMHEIINISDEIKEVLKNEFICQT